MAGRRCTQRGCPRIITNGNTRCNEHTKQQQQQRGTTTQRGYGHKHQRLRAQWRARIDTGHVTCARCGTVIPQGAPFDLGHDDEDRTKYSGPEHVTCNRSAGGRAAHKYRHPGE